MIVNATTSWVANPVSDWVTTPAYDPFHAASQTFFAMKAVFSLLLALLLGNSSHHAVVVAQTGGSGHSELPYYGRSPPVYPSRT